jgi:hypothetical protein
VVHIVKQRPALCILIILIPSCGTIPPSPLRLISFDIWAGAVGYTHPARLQRISDRLSQRILEPVMNRERAR